MLPTQPFPLQIMDPEFITNNESSEVLETEEVFDISSITKCGPIVDVSEVVRIQHVLPQPKSPGD